MNRNDENYQATQVEFHRIKMRGQNVRAAERGQIAIGLCEQDARENARNRQPAWAWTRFNAERARTNHGDNVRVYHWRELERRIRTKGPRIPQFAHARSARTENAEA
jgi:hypothetical protein